MSRTIGMTTTLAVALALAACGEPVDTTGLPSAEGYTTWYKVTTDNPLPAHGDTVRDIYVNDVARTYPHGGRYPIGSVLVKEIYAKRGDGTRGDLSYVAIMRKVSHGGQDDEGAADIDAPVEGGWVLTSASSPGAEETYRDLCWLTCHKQAPFDGAWLDYGE